VWSLGITCIELLIGEPPHANLHPMRALFLIPQNDAPTLEGNFSKTIKEFVSLCLNKDQAERPSVTTLLKHKLFKNSKKNNILVELLDKYQRWKVNHPDDEEDSQNPEPASEDPNGDITFDLDTIKPKSNEAKVQKEALAAEFAKKKLPPKFLDVDPTAESKRVSRAWSEVEEDKKPEPKEAKDAAVAVVKEAKETPKESPKERERERERDKAPITDPFWVTVIKPSVTKLKLEMGSDSSSLNSLVNGLEELERDDPKKLRAFVTDVVQSVSK